MTRILGQLWLGIALLAAGLILATILSIAAGFDWLMTALVTMTVIGAISIAFTFAPTPSGGTGVGSWTAFNDLRGSGLGTISGASIGGRSGSGHQTNEWDFRSIINGLIPMLAAVLLLVAWIVR
ncbi:MAG: hypothetical protein R3A46_09485 [Thermomicrobiales bacterium]